MADLQTRPARKFKVVLLGEGRVGKTSILLRYIKGEYTDQQVSTLQASYLDKRLMVDNKRVHLSIWDTAGQERFHALGPIYYRDADGAVLVYDITDDESFRKVRNWVKELRRIVGEEIDILIAGNKSDLHRNRKVNEEEAIQYATSVGATHFCTSAKLNRNLEDVFIDLTKRMLRRKATSGRKGKTSTLIADDDEVQAKPPHTTSSIVGGYPTQHMTNSFGKTVPPRSAPNTYAEKAASSVGYGKSVPGPNLGSRNSRVMRTRQHSNKQASQHEHDMEFVDDDGLLDDFKERPSASGALRVRGASSNGDVSKAKSNCC